MQNFLFDKEIVNNQLSVLNNTLASQRHTKKTLLSHLENFSDAMYENFNSDNTDSLLSLINEAHSIFEYIKSNISKTIELKKFLENISNSDFLNTIDSEKFNKEFNELLDNISKTNSSYLSFMNNYEAFINPSSINKNEENENSISEDCITPQKMEEDYLNHQNESISENEEPIPQINLPEKELIINKKLGIAILPYSISDLDEVFLNNPEKYTSIQDIIEQEYTIQLKDFENSSITRFKEAFKLAKNRSNYTFYKQLTSQKNFL